MQNTVKVAIIGDLFMRADAFEAALPQSDDFRFDVKKHETFWPDKPFNQEPIEGVKEYQGTPEEVADLIGDAEICITHLGPITRSVFEKCPNLKLVAVSRGGPVNVDIAAASERGIKVVNAPGRNASAVAEFTIGAILAQTRMITVGHEGMRQNDWRGDLYREDTTGEELCRMTVGLLGYSAVGQRVARLLHPFGPKIIICDPYVDLTAEDKKMGVVKCDFDTLLEKSDVLSLHLRVTEETKQIISKQALSKMKPGAFFINTSRGELVDQPALVEALKNGPVRGAALDTFAVEPPLPDDAISKLPNVTLTPHIAGASVNTVTFAAEMIGRQIDNYLRGQPLENQC